jgi:hypothetical protein
MLPALGDFYRGVFVAPLFSRPHLGFMFAMEIHGNQGKLWEIMGNYHTMLFFTFLKNNM